MMPIFEWGQLGEGSSEGSYQNKLEGHVSIQSAGGLPAIDKGIDDF